MHNNLRRLLAISLLATGVLSQPSSSTAAGANNLAHKIAAGKWELTYRRTGEFKPLFYKHKESGSSSTCIDGDPRQHILDWVSSKGCRVDREQLLADRYRLSGECRLKWMQGHPVPVDVDLIFGDRNAFVLDIRTRDAPLLSFREHTRARYAGGCPAK
jgi:hypothetical protein